MSYFLVPIGKRKRVLRWTTPFTIGLNKIPLQLLTV